MKRRALLVGLVASASGCAAVRDAANGAPLPNTSSTRDSTGGSDGTGTRRNGGTGGGATAGTTAESDAEGSDDPLPPSSSGTVSQFDPAGVFESVSVGDARNHHHRIVVWNDAPEEREISVRLRDADAGRTVVDAAMAYPAYHAFEMLLSKAADYVLAVTPAGEAEQRLGVPKSFIDCDASKTAVAVRPGGAVDAAVSSTAVLCDFGG